MTFPAWTLSAGVAVLVCGTLLAMLPRGVRRGLLLQAIGVVLTSAAGCSVLAGAAGFGSAFGDGLGPSAGVDPLSGAFLVAIGLAAAPALVFASGYLQGAAHARATAATTGIFALALVGVVVARDAVSFLLMWELMSLAPAATILIASRSREVCRVVLVYLGMTHVAAAGVWLSVLTLAHLHAFSNAHAMSGQSSLVRSLVAGAALVGFGTKAGLMPFHTWLPRAHPVAPGPVSAIMSGVMIKVALYGLVRMLFWWIQPLPHWVAPVLLASAIVSCVGGVLAALLQDELKRVLAFSSIENVGIIALGLAVSLIATSSGHPGRRRVGIRSGVAAHAESCRVQITAVSVRRVISAAGWQARAQRPGRLAADDAADGRGISGRIIGNRRGSAIQWVCLRVADVPGADPACPALIRARCVDGRCRGGSAGGDCSAWGVLLRARSWPGRAWAAPEPGHDPCRRGRIFDDVAGRGAGWNLPGSWCVA